MGLKLPSGCGNFPRRDADVDVDEEDLPKFFPATHLNAAAECQHHTGKQYKSLKSK